MRKTALLGCFFAALAFTPAAFAGRNAPAVFVQTNELAGNHVVVYDRGADGRLTQAGTYATGGNGGAAAPGTESDRLASQGSLAYDAGRSLLVAVNAGSDSISAFKVQGAPVLRCVLDEVANSAQHGDRGEAGPRVRRGGRSHCAGG